MKKVSLSGSKRENVGKKDAAALRRANRVPAVLYGGATQTHFHVSINDANRMYKTQHVYLVDLEVEGKKSLAIIQELQINPVTDVIRHIDFLEVTEDKPVKVKLPIKLTGFSVGVRNGGKLRQHFRRVTVSGMLKDLPETLDIDITNMKINSKYRISDIKVPGVTVLDAPNSVAVAVQMARGASLPGSEDEEEEGGEEAAAE
jgi:large subunit ribosomal protein L25